MSASGGPAADNNELRAKLVQRTVVRLHDNECPDRACELTHFAGVYIDAATVLVDALLPLVVAFGDARYQEGRTDAASDIGRNVASLAWLAAQPVSVPETPARELPKPKRRLKACVEAWPECFDGGYDPRCCRFPKSCSADVYDPQYVTDDDLEPTP